MLAETLCTGRDRRRGGGAAIGRGVELRIALLLCDALSRSGQAILVSLVMRVAPVPLCLRDHKRRWRRRLSPRVGSTAAQDEPDWKRERAAAQRGVGRGVGGRSEGLRFEKFQSEMSWWRTGKVKAERSFAKTFSTARGPTADGATTRGRLLGRVLGLLGITFQG